MTAIILSVNTSDRIDKMVKAWVNNIDICSGKVVCCSFVNDNDFWDTATASMSNLLQCRIGTSKWFCSGGENEGWQPLPTKDFATAPVDYRDMRNNASHSSELHA